MTRVADEMASIPGNAPSDEHERYSIVAIARRVRTPSGTIPIDRWSAKRLSMLLGITVEEVHDWSATLDPLPCYAGGSAAERDEERREWLRPRPFAGREWED